MALVLVVSMTACEGLFGGDEEDEMPLYDSKAWLNESVINFDATKLSGGLQGSPGGKFVMAITAGQEWASFSSSSSVTALPGRLPEGEMPFYIYVGENETTSARSGEVTIKFTNGKTFALQFTQRSESSNMGYDRAWGEHPAYNGSNTNYVHKTYYTTLSGHTTPVRNFSICYDLQKKVSQWVAYPLHSVYTGGAFKTRTNAWAFDDAVSSQPASGESYKDNLHYVITQPEIPQDKQQNIIEGSYGYGYNRGHMLPSASRYSTWMTNAQTFYATNMFPQNGTLNSGRWGDLEGYARRAMCSDTLYCVVGTLYENNPPEVIDSRGRTITVPSHCYKLLLRTKSGNTGKHISQITNADEIIAIGFVWENSYEGNSVVVKDAALPISEIERRSGFSFFRELNPAIAAKVKAQNNYEEWRKAFGLSK